MAALQPAAPVAATDTGCSECGHPMSRHISAGCMVILHEDEGCCECRAATDTATERTRKAHNEFAEADSRAESALLSGDETRSDAARARLDAAAEGYSAVLGTASVLQHASYDPYDAEAKLCDDDGTVRRGPMHHGTDYACTGHAHYCGEHIRCTSPAHAAPVESWVPYPVAPVAATDPGDAAGDTEKRLQRLQAAVEGVESSLHTGGVWQGYPDVQPIDVAKLFAADLRWTLAELARLHAEVAGLRADNAYLRRSVECGQAALEDRHEACLLAEAKLDALHAQLTVLSAENERPPGDAP